MIEVDGVEYTVSDAETNAAAMVSEINQYASDNSITNSKGELIQFEINWANPLYMLLYGCGVLFNYIQQAVYSAGCALSIASSSDRQLLNIAEICNIKRRAQTKTTIEGTVYAILEAEGDVTGCTITTSLSATVSTSSGSVVFHPAFDITLAVGESAKIILVADSTGSYNLGANTITSFDTNPSGFRTMQTLASQPGQDEETVASLRQRLQERVAGGTALDRCMTALMGLEGVSSCNIYFNKSGSESVLVNGCTVGPRQALLFIQGWSWDIAKTYWSYLTVECAGSEHESAIEQDYETNGGQLLPVYIIPPTQVPVTINLFFKEVISTAVVQNIIDTVMGLSASLIIGETLSSGDVIKVIQENYPSYTVLGCTMKITDSDSVPSYKITPNSYQLLTFNSNNFYVSTGQE